MKRSKAFIGVVAGLTLTSNVYAANKTHITDTLGAGNSKVDVSFGINGGNGKSSVLMSGSATSYNDDSKSSGQNLSVEYSRGITDRLDISITAPLVRNYKTTSEYVSGGNQYKVTDKSEGQGDLFLQAQYLILDKQQNQVDWIVAGYYSPSNASSEESTSEVTINGSVSSPGKTGKPGRGYTETGIGTALALPSRIGDVVLAASYFSGGEKTSGGVKYKYGDMKQLALYLENMISTRTTLTPFVGYSMFGGDSTGAQAYPSNSLYNVGIGLTHDVSKAFSVIVKTSYVVQKETSYTNNSGDKITYSTKSYGLTLSTLFFF